MEPGRLLLAIDTCGPTGSVALGRLAGRDLEILGQTELEGRSYSATLVAAVGDLLEKIEEEVHELRQELDAQPPSPPARVRPGAGAVADAGALRPQA